MTINRRWRHAAAIEAMVIYPKPSIPIHFLAGYDSILDTSQSNYLSKFSVMFDIFWNKEGIVRQEINLIH